MCPPFQLALSFDKHAAKYALALAEVGKTFVARFAELVRYNLKSGCPAHLSVGVHKGSFWSDNANDFFHAPTFSNNQVSCWERDHLFTGII